MRLVQFLMEQTRIRSGRIPFFQEGLEEAAWSLTQLYREKSQGVKPHNKLTVRLILHQLTERGYMALEELLGGCLTEDSSSRGNPQLEEAILKLHDAYVRFKNTYCAPASREGQKALGDRPLCLQCGECCVGRAYGPLSTSPRDIELWESLGREDLLYHTVKGAWGRTLMVQGEYFCCPFLRFSKQGKGICLIHPVKPLICRDFHCSHPLRTHSPC